MPIPTCSLYKSLTRCCGRPPPLLLLLRYNTKPMLTWKGPMALDFHTRSNEGLNGGTQLTGGEVEVPRQPGASATIGTDARGRIIIS